MAVVAPDRKALDLDAAANEQASASSRAALAAGAALLAVLVALVAALGPATGRHSDYGWPPAAVPAQAPRQGWYTPLALLNRVPASIDVRLPCGLSPPLRGGASATVLATTRRSQHAGGFEIVRVGNALRFAAGSSELASAPWPASCPLHVSVRDGEFRLPGRIVPTRLDTPGGMPIVTSLFTQLDLRRGAQPRALVQTRDYATSQTTRQIVAALFSVALACAALLLVAGIRRLRSPMPALGRGLRKGWAARQFTDVVVVGVLALWWPISPNFSDDGWLMTRFLNYSGAGGFSAYYDQYGTNLPLGFWLEWSEHFLAPEGLLVLRLPALASLLAGWLLCRWVLNRSLPTSMRANALVLWTLAAVFLVGALAWGMTLRPEPIVSLLTVIVLASVLAFTADPRIGVLAPAVPAAALALSGHTTGILATAPLIAGAPSIMRVLRTRGRVAFIQLTSLLLAGVAFTLVLFTLDSDLGRRLEDTRLIHAGGLHSEPPWHEYIRYVYFDEALGGTALRHLSLVLLLLCATALVTRRRKVRTDVSTLPARSVAVALVLLAFVPSKWPWHFGTLVEIGAVAGVVEVARLMTEARLEESRRLRALVSVLVLTVAASWSWTGLTESTPFDLVTATWATAFNVFTLLATATLIGAIVVLRSQRPKCEFFGSVAASPGIVVAATGLSAVVLTMGVVLVDTVVASWSPARLNVEALVHRTSGCGLVDQLSNGSQLAARIVHASGGSILVPPINLYVPCGETPAVEDGRVALPSVFALWLDRWPVANKDSPFQAATDLYDFRPIAHERSMSVLVSRKVVRGFRRVDAELQSAG